MAIEKKNRVAVLALTGGGARLAQKLVCLLEDADLYLPERLSSDVDLSHTAFYRKWQAVVKMIFRQYSQLIFIMATGIVVRTLAPLLQSKRTDPAVVVLDEKGQHAISLLSGHLGGANVLAQRIAVLIGGTAVITTATDVVGVPSLDVLAKALDCGVYPCQRIKLFNRLLVEGEPVQIVSPWAVKPEVMQGLTLSQPDNNRPKGPVVHITNHLVQHKGEPRLMLRPKNLVAGVGCRKGVSGEQIVTAVKGAFRLADYSLLSLKSLATVDLKMQEPGLLQAASYFRVPLIEVTREQIKNLSVQYTQSDFVKEQIGVGGVCEPAAITASGMGQIKVPKQKIGPVTVAIAEAKLWWWD
ncbi:cobalamin (vitamin B12) biosynthesis CbiG protein [Desulforamulus reducens MI-1]|uniref:Cobalamin (Vitamin B12) biosynthesis CbiG protein n=1 Tax=Desulforamulus reducens (strain ATCC BAA-1160 / DSM 100696 / MI-1) TaxID=349161 RepID=A4J811_DESRM|nr:cobalt-precorrin 5A hydrolase [Desulforamulus reducens]ABO51214.1 cobalamin (vitamin B12) biosynthesis CbiG protein [Desulforamulus reducens MI-1]